MDDRDLICYYTIVEDENDPAPPLSLLRLSEMSVDQLGRIASDNGLGGYDSLNKDELVRFMEAHRYVFSDDFYDQIKAWVGLFAEGNFVDHYSDVIINSLKNTNYLSEFVSCKREWWWDNLCLAFYYETELFTFWMDPFLVFERMICLRFELVVKEVQGYFNVGESHQNYETWCRALDSKFENFIKELNGNILCFECRLVFLTRLRDWLEEEFFKIFL